MREKTYFYMQIPNPLRRFRILSKLTPRTVDTPPPSQHVKIEPSVETEKSALHIHAVFQSSHSLLFLQNMEDKKYKKGGKVREKYCQKSPVSLNPVVSLLLRSLLHRLVWKREGILFIYIFFNG